MAVLAALGLLDADDPLGAVDVLGLQADHLARTQAATITEAESHAGLEAARYRQQTAGLVRAHHEWNLLGLADVIDLGGEIGSAQRHAEQEAQPGHGAVAVGDAHPRLDQVQLE